MEVFLAFIFGLVFSFLGSIPPGILNITIIQLGLEHRLGAAWRFAVAAAIIEYPYAWLAISFEKIIAGTPSITGNLQLISALVLLLLGVLNLWSARNVDTSYKKFSSSGFRRGLILSLLNPMALPFWIGITAYLKSNGLIALGSQPEIHSYLFGVSLGALVLLISLAYLAKTMIRHFEKNTFLKKIPGATLVVLGIYGLVQYFL